METDSGCHSALQGSYSRMSMGSSTLESPTSSLCLSENRRSFSISNGSMSGEDDDRIRIPKLGLADGNDLEELNSCLSPISQLRPAVESPLKKPRGRPRKPPCIVINPALKSTKARSKTGCVTCRLRKKKCDEAKPTCLNCKRNNTICEGYQTQQMWQSGKHKIEGEHKSPRVLPLFINGVETDEDKILLDHFNINLSRVLSLWKEEQNPFSEILMPMALEHRGLMHSLLCLAGSHLSATDLNPAINERKDYHYSCAIRDLLENDKIAAHTCDPKQDLIGDSTVAQTLILCLRSITAGETNGEYRSHLDATRHLVTCQKSSNQDFQNFLVDFFIYHDISNSITSLDRRPLLLSENFLLPQFVQAATGSFLGVLDGLFTHISKITNLRDKIRHRRSQNLKPAVDFGTLSDAQAIDADLRSWVCTQTPNTTRHTASLLYRQCSWIYLHRTIMPSVPAANLHLAVDVGLGYLRELLAPDSAAQAVLLMPVFLLACAAFDVGQRPEIGEAFEMLQEYRCSGNIAHARKVVEKVWEMMDRGDDESWDWETVMNRMGWDFLVT